MSKKILIFMVPVLLLGALSPAPAASADSKYNIKTMTPQVEKALENRRERYGELGDFKARGIIGENNQGYVEVLKSDVRARALAGMENTDRKVIYQTIADQNGLTSEIKIIEKVFARVQRDKADKGDMIQSEDGNWVKK